MNRARRAGWTVAFAGCIICTVAFAAGAAGAESGVRGQAVTDTLTTQSGVYTDEQANRGKQAFYSVCLSCHATSEQSGDSFDQHWKDHPLSDLFTYVQTQMPQNDPGSMDQNTTADVVAFLLKLNAMPAGQTELVPDTAAMSKVRITRTKGPTP